MSVMNYQMGQVLNHSISKVIGFPRLSVNWLRKVLKQKLNG
jgi:hypothetical protein